MVGNILRLMFNKGLNIIRWNNFPRVIDVKHMDNVGFTLHIALYLAYHEEHIYGNKIDTLFLIKYILFSSFEDLILSDIHAETKLQIQKHNKKMYSELLKKTHEYIYNFEGNEDIKQDLKNILEDQEHSLEKKLFLSAKKYAGLVESAPNNTLFPNIYADVTASMHEYLDTAGGSIESVHFLLTDNNSKKYLDQIYRLCFSMRWNRYRRKTPISVMSHHVIVMYLSYTIAMQEGLSDTEILDMMVKALYHDVPEVITGDIVTPTKSAVDGFKDLLAEVEEEMIEDKLFCYLSDDYKDFIRPYILPGPKSENDKKVKFADTISAYLEAEIEAENGNAPFIPVSKKVLLWCDHIENSAVQTIMREIYDSFHQVEEDLLAEHNKNRNKGQLKLPLVKSEVMKKISG